MPLPWGFLIASSGFFLLPGPGVLPGLALVLAEGCPALLLPPATVRLRLFLILYENSSAKHLHLT
jgi:hypothetical protein